MATPVNRDIKYLNRDFSNIRESLIEFSKTYFPNTYNDFTPSSPGMMFMEQAAYVGDVMSFYLDNQLEETFTQFAQQTNNLYELAYMFGYKPKATGASQVMVDLYQQLPSKLVGASYVPDYDYALTIGENSTIPSSLSIGVDFIMEDKCDFSFSSSLDPTEVSIYSSAGGIPQFYLIKKQRKAISATINTKDITFSSFKPFPTIDVVGNDIIGILDIIDSEGNTWYEVDYLGQEMIFDNIRNTNIHDPNVTEENEIPFLLKLKKVQRRFATRLLSQNILQIQFGAGNPNDTDELITPNPNNVGIGLPFEKNKLTTAYSPTNFLFTNTYGIAPSDITLRVRYLTGGGVNSNVPAGDLTDLNKASTKFNVSTLNATTADYIYNSLSCNNEKAADGGKAGDTINEIRQNTLMQIATQQRTVTLDDYMVRALSMPGEYGIVTKAYIEKPKLTDEQVSTIESLNMYVLSQNLFGQLSQASTTLKKNLRTYLNQYRMIGDNIEIKDAYVINIGIDFEIIVLPNFINSQVILACIDSLQEYFDVKNWQMNQPILIRDLYVRLDRIEGVQTVKNIMFSNKAGTMSGYSEYSYDIDGATQNQVIYPSLDPSIFEIKYPQQDIKGRVVPL